MQGSQQVTRVLLKAASALGFFVGAYEFGAQAFKRLSIKIESQPPVIDVHGKVKNFLIIVCRHGRKTPAAKQAVHDFPASPGIIEQCAVPVPDDIAVFQGLYFAARKFMRLAYGIGMKCALTTLLLILLVVTGLLFWVDRSPPDVRTSYEDALAATSPERMRLMVPGDEIETGAKERFMQLWKNFTPEYLSANVTSVYAANAWFNDTVRTITNHADLAHYMSETAGRVASCRIEFLNIMHVEGSYFSRWKMIIQPDEKKPNDIWESYGISHLRFNESGQVVLHQDYWDSAGGLHDHLPGVGWILRNIRARL